MNVVESNKSEPGSESGSELEIEPNTDPSSKHTNGNREKLEESKPGGAQSGGPDIEKARERQPPGATRPHQTTHH
ncbi:MAG: hypothetical protein V4692_07025 [Bdellovibrionota bacterium]